MTVCVLAACVMIFLGVNTLGDSRLYVDLAKFGVFPESAIWEGKPWALITSAFVHFEIWHIFFNLYWLWLLGGPLERDIGALPWALFVFVAAWVSSSMQLSTGDTGIGLSGVVYALFGFAWMGRDKLPNTRPIVHDGTVNTFLVWFVLAIILTKLGWMNIGNAAHFGGLIFGVGIGAIYAKRHSPALLIPAVALLLAASFVPLFYCPLSSEWTAQQAVRLQQKGDLAASRHWYLQTMALGSDKSWAWRNLALIAIEQRDRKAFDEALSEIRRSNPQTAKEMQQLWPEK